MKLSERHQKALDEHVEAHPKFKAALSGEEKDYFHIMYIDIKPDGDRTRDVPVFQKYSVQDWGKTKKLFEGKGPIVGSIRVTGHNEYSVIYDPTVREAEAKPEMAEVKPEAKPKGRPSLK